MQSIFIGIALLVSLGQIVPGGKPASMPVDESEREGNRLRATPNDVHALYRHDFPQDGPGDGFAVSRKDDTIACTSSVIATEFPFNDLVPSFNVVMQPGMTFYAEVRVGRREGDFWTPYYYLGQYGPRIRLPDRHTEDAHGEVNIDYFQSKQAFDRFQYRITLLHARDAKAIRRVTFAYSNTLNDAALAAKFRKAVDPGPKKKWARRLPIPYRSQKWEDARIRGMICSPTSTSMVLEYRGVKRPTVEVCEHIWDPEYKLYGNWWHAVQGAFTFGVPGYVERFGGYDAVKRHIASGQPVIASIKVRKGELRNAPYRETNGHLLVITGFTESGDICINDPAGTDAEHGGIVVYPAEDMKKIWLDNGGIGYIIEPLPGG